MSDHRSKTVYNQNANAIAYYRYSSSAQREESIEEQRTAAHRYAESHGLTIVKEYSDAAQSGTDDTRPGFVQMKYEAKILKPGHLILWKLDRLARDALTQFMARKELSHVGVRIECVAEPLPEDEAQNKFISGIYALMSEQYIDNMKANIVRGMNYNAEHCLYNGHKTFGYVGKASEPYKIDEQTAPYVRKIFREYADGVPAMQIVDELNAAGVLTPKGKQFRAQTINKILTNEAYIGVYRFGEYRTEGGMPRLVDDATWVKVQERLKQNQRGGRKTKTEDDGLKPEQVHDFWLTGHIYCGECGEPMHASFGTSKTKDRHFYYVCNGKVTKKNSCMKKGVRAEVLEGMVTDILEEFIHEPAIRLMLADECWKYYQLQNEGADAYLKSIENDLKDVEKRIGNVMKAIEAGIITESTKERLDELEGQKQMLKAQVSAEKSRQKLRLTEDNILKFLDSFVSIRTKDKLDRERLLLDLVEKIYVYDDKIVVTLYYTGEKKEVAFDDYKRMWSTGFPMGGELPELSEEKLAALKGDDDGSFDDGVNLPRDQKGSTTNPSAPLY